MNQSKADKGGSCLRRIRKKDRFMGVYQRAFVELSGPRRPFCCRHAVKA